MPLHRIYYPPGIYSAEDKKEISERITAVYTGVGLPAFYVVVIFIAVDEESFLVGGKPASKFVRLVTSHVARTTVGSEAKAFFMQKLVGAVSPYTSDRGLNWEVDIEEHDRELWRVDGLVPPLPGTESEKNWVRLNKAVPY